MINIYAKRVTIAHDQLLWETSDFFIIPVLLHNSDRVNMQYFETKHMRNNKGIQKKRLEAPPYAFREHI